MILSILKFTKYSQFTLKIGFIPLKKSSNIIFQEHLNSL